MVLRSSLVAHLYLLSSSSQLSQYVSRSMVRRFRRVHGLELAPQKSVAGAKQPYSAPDAFCVDRVWAKVLSFLHPKPSCCGSWLLLVILIIVSLYLSLSLSVFVLFVYLLARILAYLSVLFSLL